MAATQSDSVILSNAVLDLDDVNNIGHPCWEYLDPKPNIHKLFNRFNNLFFERILCNRVNLEWCDSMNKKNAGETLPSRAKDNHSNKILIRMNPKLMENRLRREIIEVLLHEMIHAYLIVKAAEDMDHDEHFHGENFILKMTELNHLTKLNMTVTHDFPTKRQSSNAEISETSKRYMWRCRGKCQNMSPYFGFCWGNNNEPCDLMWVDKNICDHHEYERFHQANDPEQWMTEWACIKEFNRFVLENEIPVKSKQFYPADFDVIDHPFKIVFNTELSDEMFENYDRKIDDFICTDKFLYDLNNNSLEESRTICMICCRSDWPEDSVIAHLNACSGLEYELSIKHTLPIMKIKSKNKSKKP